MPQAVWNDAVLAESQETVVIEGNHYFPPESLDRRYFRESNTETVCGWKGTAKYYDIHVNDQTNSDAAWYYPTPKPEAQSIAGHVAFWKGVQIQ